MTTNIRRLFIIPGYLLLVSVLPSCKKDSFLDRSPVSGITVNNFFNNSNDLNTYCNGLYSFLPTTSLGIADQQSDNFENNPFNKVVAGQLTIPTSADQATQWDVNTGSSQYPSNGWNWTFLRQINYFLQNYGKASASDAIKNHYAGVARFFRAWFYADKIKQYGDVPWYGTQVQPNDSADLYKARDPRAKVTDSILADLRFASANVNPTGPSGTITKWAALALLARIALHEGTFREYRGQAGWQPLLQVADSAAQAIMTSKTFSLYSTGNTAQDYQNLFLTFAPGDAQNKEIILARFYSNALHVNSAIDGYLVAYGHSVTKDLMNTYLTQNGTPFTSKPGYDTMMVTTEFTNRDPRLAQTILPPTATLGTINGWSRIGPAPTGYQPIKYYDPNTPGYNTNYNAALIFRYAEILLIHAEAAAELGTLTQGDLDISVNLLRARAGMPSLSMGVPVDPVLVSAYPAVTGALQNVILEIRRERRVELACEGQRYDDLMRWKAGALLAKQFLGVYFPHLGAYDLNGDGTTDIELVTSKPTAVYQKQIGVDIFLTNTNSGNIIPNPTLSKSFDENKNYLFPLPTTELLLNRNMQQNPGWK